jgi:hypothetical protein
MTQAKVSRFCDPAGQRRSTLRQDVVVGKSANRSVLVLPPAFCIMLPLLQYYVMSHECLFGFPEQ